MAADSLLHARHQAVALREQGLGYRRIAAATGLSTTTIIRWLNPEYAEKSRLSSNAAKERNRGTCERCGAPTNACLGPGKASKVCASCAPAVYGPRYRAERIGQGPVIRQVLAYLSEERSYTEIATHFGWSKGGTAARLNRWTNQGQIVRVAHGRYRRVEW